MKHASFNLRREKSKAIYWWDFFFLRKMSIYNTCLFLGEPRNWLYWLWQAAGKCSPVPPQAHHCRYTVLILFILTNKNAYYFYFFSHRNKLLFSQPWLCSHEADCWWERRLSDGRHGTHQRAGGCWSCAITLWAQWHRFHNNTQDTARLPRRTHFLQKRYKWSNQSFS